MQGPIYIVDTFNYLFRAFHALPPLRTRGGLHTGAIYGLCQMLLRIEREQRPTHLCAVLDSPIPTFRKELYAQYKAHRPAMPPELSEQLTLVPTVIEAFGISTLQVPGFEADDVIATVTRMARERGLDVVICSSDKDLMQLVGPRVSILDTMKNRMLGPDDVTQKWGVPPERVGDLLALVGDSSDNIPGVPDVGPKTAAQWVIRYGDLDQIMAHAEEIGGKRGRSLMESRAAVVLSRRLVTLVEDVKLPKSLEDLQRIPPNRESLQSLFRELEFTRLLEGLSPGPKAKVDEAKVDEAKVDKANVDKAVDAPPQSSQPGLPGLSLSGASAPTTPLRQVVADEAALAALVPRLEKATQLAVTVLCDGSPLAGELVAIALAPTPESQFMIPVTENRTQRLLGAQPSLEEAAVLEALRPILGSPHVAKLTHDGKSLEVVMGRRGVPVNNIAFDAMLSSYLIDPSRSQYDLDAIAQAENLEGVQPRSAWLGNGRKQRSPRDIPAAELAAALGAETGAIVALAPIHKEKLVKAGLDGLLRDVELPLAHVLADIERAGVKLDAGFLRQLSQEVGRGIADLESEIHQLAGSTFNIGSPKQLQKVLFEDLGLPVARKTKTGASTDHDVLESLAALHTVPAKILEYRSLTKLKNTYIDALPALVNARTGRLHTTFNQAVAATGRLSSSDPNLQNIPIRTPLGRRIREAFVADPDFLILSADYSQIELRILAHFSEDPAFVEAFNSGQDIHQRTAAEVFGVSLDEVTPEQRRIAKAINFGLVFGQSDFGLSQALRIPRIQARTYIESYFARYAGVKAYMDRTVADARVHGEVSTLLGRRRAIPELSSARAPLRAQGDRMARNTPIQGSAADILKLAMIGIFAGLKNGAAPVSAKDAYLVLTVHDELVFEVRATQAEALAGWVKSQMENAYKLRVPLVVDVGWGPTWGQAH